MSKGIPDKIIFIKDNKIEELNTSIQELQKRLTEKTFQLDNARDFIKITKAYIAYKQYNTATNQDLAYRKCVIRQDIVNDTNCQNAWQKITPKDRLPNQQMPALYAAKLFDEMENFEFDFKV